MLIHKNMLTIAINSSRISWYLGPSISVTILITDPSARGGRYAYARSTNARYKGVLIIWDWIWKEWLFVSLIETEDIVPGRMPPVRTIEKEWAGRGGPMPGGFKFITTINIFVVKWKYFVQQGWGQRWEVLESNQVNQRAVELWGWVHDDWW